MAYYEVDLIEMGYIKGDPESSTADGDEWNVIDKPDMYNVLVTEHADDGSGEIEMILDIDFPPYMAGLASTFYSLCDGLADYANTHNVRFGSVVNPHVPD